MISTLKPAHSAPEWLVPGQRFRSSDPSLPGEFTLARIVRDSMGLCHAVLFDGLGHRVSTYVAQIHCSIEHGMLTPIESTSRITRN